MKNFTTTYRKRTTHRRRCRLCSKLVQDGEQVRMVLAEKEQTTCYGNHRRYNKWYFAHESCAAKSQSVFTREE